MSDQVTRRMFWIPRMFCMWIPERLRLWKIGNAVQGIGNPINDWNQEPKFPLTKSEIQYLESGIESVESGI